MKIKFEDYNFQQWLDYIQQQHPKNIDLGLDRISKVAARLDLPSTAAKTVIIGGTNGKGTTLAILESIAIANNHTVFSYSSPHLFKFNERIRINGEMVSDTILMEAFIRIENSRNDTLLTFFEFTTLSAMLIQSNSSASIALYEVGLGGRLDAVNILHPDISIITSIALDHTDWLGETIEQIAFEKMAIGRKHKPLLIADLQLPQALIEMAYNNSDDCLLMGKDFNCSGAVDGYSKLQISDKSIQISVPENIHANNIAGASMAASLLGLEINKERIEACLNTLFLPARFERLLNNPSVYIDVSHNQQAINVLQQRISHLEKPIQLVCGMLSDKLNNDVLKPLKENDYFWYLTSLDAARGATATELKVILSGEPNIRCFENIKFAMESAFNQAQGHGSIVVFGSFITAEFAAQFMQSRLECLT